MVIESKTANGRWPKTLVYSRFLPARTIKKGALKDARVADLRYNDGITYRAVFTIDEAEHAVDVLALDPHDKAYQVASNRI
jgi:hypothetical protein